MGLDLKLLLPQTSIPIAPYDKASGGAFAAPAETLERGGQRLEVLAAQTLLAVREADDAKKAMEARVEAGRLRSGFRRSLAEGEATLRQTVVDPDAYYDQVLAHGTQQMEAILAGDTKHPETRAYLAPLLSHDLDQSRTQALAHRISKTKSATNAGIDETVDNYTALARQSGFDAIGTTLWAGHASAALAALQDGIPVNGPDATGDQTRLLKERLFKDRAEAHERTDPVGFLQDGPKLYQGPLGAGKVALLENQARTRIDTLNRAANAEWEAFYKTVDKDAERERQAQVDELDSLAEQSQLSRQRLEDARVMRIAVGEDYRRLSKALDAPDKAAKSDPDVYDPIALRVHSSQLTVPDIDSLEREVNGKQGHGITTKDALALKDKLKANRDVLVTKGDSLAFRQHQQAEQEVTLMAGVVAGTITEKLDPVSKKILTTFIPELRMRSSAYKEGGEAPLAVLDSMKPRIEAMLGAGSIASPAQVASKLRYPQTMAPVEMSSRLEAEFRASTVSPGEYRAQKGYILEYDKALREAEKTKARLDALKGAGGAKPATGVYRPPKAGERKAGD